MSAPESTSATESMVFRVCDGEINCTGIFMDLGDKDIRTGETVVMDCFRGTEGNIWSMKSVRGDM